MNLKMNNNFWLVIECHLQCNNGRYWTKILWLLTSIKFLRSPSSLLCCLPNSLRSLENENFSFHSNSVKLVNDFLIDFLELNDQTTTLRISRCLSVSSSTKFTLTIIDRYSWLISNWKYFLFKQSMKGFFDNRLMKKQADTSWLLDINWHRHCSLFDMITNVDSFILIHVDWLISNERARLIITNEYIWLYYCFPPPSPPSSIDQRHHLEFFFFRPLFFFWWLAWFSPRLIRSLCSVYWDGWMDACWFILSSSYLFTSVLLLTSPWLILDMGENSRSSCFILLLISLMFSSPFVLHMI